MVCIRNGTNFLPHFIMKTGIMFPLLIMVRDNKINTKRMDIQPWLSLTTPPPCSLLLGLQPH